VHRTLLAGQQKGHLSFNQSSSNNSQKYNFGDPVKPRISPEKLDSIRTVHTQGGTWIGLNEPGSCTGLTSISSHTNRTRCTVSLISCYHNTHETTSLLHNLKSTSVKLPRDPQTTPLQCHNRTTSSRL